MLIYLVRCHVIDPLTHHTHTPKHIHSLHQTHITPSHTPSFTQSSLEVSIEDVNVPGAVVDIPKRLPWSYSVTKDQLESQEEALFNDYLKNIYFKYNPERLSYFEHNLQVSPLFLFLCLSHSLSLSLFLSPQLSLCAMFSFSNAAEYY